MYQSVAFETVIPTATGQISFSFYINVKLMPDFYCYIQFHNFSGKLNFFEEEEEIQVLI